MIKNEYYVIGVMSGTSLDGIDLLYARFKYFENWDFDIIRAETIHYDEDWNGKLENLVNLSIEELKLIDKEYTHLLANVINSFIARYKIKCIDAICSHGHTAYHQPENKLTYQIGNQPIISKLVGQTVVCDFRIQDVELGGQGAPLVPIGDKLLFPGYDFCLNLGGFANLSVDINNERIAFDVCPVNILLNSYVKKIGYDFDDKGKMASQGKQNDELLSKLNDLEFYRKSYPKSLGLEWVKTSVIPLIDEFNLEPPDILNTLCEHIAIQISNEINKIKKASVLITGGGTYNDYLINRIKSYSQNEIEVPSKQIIDFKEALIFALLGILRLRKETNCLKSVTGASKDHSSGNIFYPHKIYIN